MKNYTCREELINDVKFIKDMVPDKLYRNHMINILFEQWMNTSPDSPWYENNEVEYDEKVDKELINDAAETLVKISNDGKSNEWNGTHTVFNDVKHPKGRNKYYNLRQR